MEDQGTVSAVVPNRLRSAAVAVALVALVAGLAFAGFTFASSSGGAATPELAVERFFAAIAAGDPVGVVETLAPAERAALQGPSADILGHLGRAGLLPSAGSVPGRGVTVTVDAIGLRRAGQDGTAIAVDVVAGRLQADLTGVGDDAKLAASAGLGLDLSEPLRRDFALDPARIVTVQDQGRWYVSALGSLAPRGSSITNRDPGAATAEDAVRDLLAGLAADDQDAVRARIVQEAGGPIVLGADALFPFRQPGRPSIGRTITIRQLELTSEGDDEIRRVRVTRLVAELVTDVHRAEITAADGCFTVVYRFDGEDPFATYRTCAGGVSEVRIPLGQASGLLAGLDQARDDDPDRLRSSLRERQQEAARAERGEPERPGVVELPHARPIDTPFSAMAVFGGGAELPTFVVVRSPEGWFVNPLRTFVTSVDAVLATATPDDVLGLGERVANTRASAEAERVATEAIDPDNMLFGNSVRNRLAAACFTEVFPVVGEAVATKLYPACVRRLVAAGRLDPLVVAPSELIPDCYGRPPVTPPDAADPTRRLYLSNLALQACAAEQVAAGRAPATVLDQLPQPRNEPCWAPYLALGPTDAEARWRAADAEVRQCLTGRLRANEPR